MNQEIRGREFTSFLGWQLKSKILYRFFFSSQVFFFPEFPSIQTVPNEVIVDSVVRAIVDRPLGSSLELSTGEVSMVGRCFTTVDGGPMLHHRCIKISSSVESKMSTKT